MNTEATDRQSVATRIRSNTYSSGSKPTWLRSRLCVGSMTYSSQSSTTTKTNHEKFAAGLVPSCSTVCLYLGGQGFITIDHHDNFRLGEMRKDDLIKHFVLRLAAFESLVVKARIKNSSAAQIVEISTKDNYW
jgi:hypothetical protein